MNRNKRMALLALLGALAVVINIVENLFIPPLSFGIRFGLANIISLVTLKLFGIRELLYIVLLRLTIGNLVKGSLFAASFWISTSGIILSSAVIIILDKLKSSVLFTSMISAISHSLGQMIAVVILYNQINVAMLLPMLIITSLATGVLTGLITNVTLKRIRIK